MDRQRWLIISLVFGCFCGLFLLCFGDALWGGGQFGYRDAGHFYYPLYQRVQDEWQQGRWPLWEPEENSGMPAPGQSDRGGALSGQADLRLASLCLGGSPLHHRPCRTGLRGHAHGHAVVAGELGRVRPGRA